MDYSKWLNLVRQAGSLTDFVDQNWLQQQFAAGVSPAIVAAQIKSYQAPTVQSTPQPTATTYGQPAPVVQQPIYGAHAAPPSNPSFPKDGVEWQVSTVLTMIIGAGCFYGICLNWWTMILMHNDFPSRGAEINQTFASSVAPFVIGILLMSFFQRRLLLYSPVRQWPVRSFLIAYGIILGLIAIIHLTNYLNVRSQQSSERTQFGESPGRRSF